MKSVLMKCGHTANAKDKNGNQVCVICTGITPNAEIIQETKPDISERMAKCDCCKTVVKSDFDLAFFRHNPTKELDSYYCGCMGWD